MELIKSIMFLSLIGSLMSGCSNNNNEKPSHDESEEPVSYKFACIGDSLTFGHAWHNESYPVYLGQYFQNEGLDIQVDNFGINGVSITGYGGSWNNYNNRYITTSEYQRCLNYQPDFIVIMLGSNDANNWNSARDIYESEYCTLISSIEEELEDVEIIIMTL